MKKKTKKKQPKAFYREMCGKSYCKKKKKGTGSKTKLLCLFRIAFHKLQFTMYLDVIYMCSVHEPHTLT